MIEDDDFTPVPMTCVECGSDIAPSKWLVDELSSMGEAPSCRSCIDKALEALRIRLTGRAQDE